MAEEIGVDVERIQQMATALENLRDVLAANVPIIVTSMNQAWSSGTGQPISLLPLQQAVGKSAEDASAILARAEMAEAYQSQANAQLPGNMVNIPWDPSAAQLNVESPEAIARDLAAAEAESAKDPAAARLRIEAIEAEVQDHLDTHDTAWLQGFYDNAAPSVAGLALVLHNEDASGFENYNDNFTVLSRADQKILATFGDGLAAADKAGLSPTAVQAIVNAPSPWSAAMLIKFGPSGSDYATAEINPATGKDDDPSLLAQLTDKIYEDQANGKLQIPMGDGSNFQSSDFTKCQDAIADFEPLTPLLQADAQNVDASWQVLGGPDGSGIAHQLLTAGVIPGAGNITYAYPLEVRGKRPAGVTAIMPVGSGTPMPADLITVNNTVPPSVVAAFLDAATSAGRGGSAADKLSAMAAANIILNTPPGWADNGIPQPSFDPDVERALTTTFLRYMPDIAFSTTGNGGLPDGQPDYFQLYDAKTKQPLTGWMFSLPQGSYANFLQQLSSTPQNYGLIKGAVSAAAGNALGMNLQNKGQTGIDYYTNDTSLYGTLIQENTNLKYSAGQMLDAINAQLNAEIAFGEQFIKDIPVVGNAASTALQWDQQLAAAGFPQIPQFSTDNAANDLTSAKQAMEEAEIKANIPIIQGLAQNNVTVTIDMGGQQVPENVAQVGAAQGWYKDGQIVDNEAFRNWWEGAASGSVQNKSVPGEPYNTLNYWLGDWQRWMEQAAGQANTTGS
jgi:hypothetical protein